MDFVAFDFETANSRADSACQLAMVVVKDATIIQERSWLIRPPQLRFSYRNVQIHGIRPEDVADAPSMEQVWQACCQWAEHNTLVAHNALFDMGVLVASLAAHDVACPELNFTCTRAIARRTWLGRTSYGLAPLGNWLGIQFRHHDALEDARCCAQILLAAAQTLEVRSLEELESKLRLTRGKTSLGRTQGPRAIGSSTPRRPTLTGPHRAPSTARGQIVAGAVLAAAADAQPLLGKRIICLGALRGLSLEETRELVEKLGAIWQTKISSDTHYVVACGGMLSEQARQKVLEDQPEECIRVLSERQFLSLIPGGKSAIQW